MYQLKNKLNKEDCLKNLAAEDFERVTLSFYRYVDVQHPRAFRDELFRQWNELGIFGRVYVAKEGINAQISVPEHSMEAFKANLDSHEALKGMYLNIAVEQGSSFYKLCIKVKQQIVADKLPEENFDLSERGKHLTAEEYNAAIDAGATVIDMRNAYESRIGRFEGAVTPDCDTFWQEVHMVEDMLEDKKDEKVLLYCTGGVRCEKFSAYLKHKGFSDVNQLKGGIITYARECEEKGLESKFKGANFVFDERLAERITDDVLSKCDQCESSCDTYANCSNASCNMLFIQCGTCADSMDGACSKECQRVFNLPEAERKAHYAKQKSATFEAYRKRIRPQLSMKA